MNILKLKCNIALTLIYIYTYKYNSNRKHTVYSTVYSIDIYTVSYISKRIFQAPFLHKKLFLVDINAFINEMYVYLLTDGRDNIAIAIMAIKINSSRGEALNAFYKILVCSPSVYKQPRYQPNKRKHKP